MDLARPWLERAHDLTPHNIWITRMYAWVEMLAGDYDAALHYWSLSGWGSGYDPLDLWPARMLTGRRDYLRAKAILERFFIRIRDPAPLEPEWRNRQEYTLLGDYYYGDLLLRMGLEAGFRPYTRRIGRDGGHFALPGIPRWDGITPLPPQHLFIEHQLGYGDQLLFCSLLPELVEAGYRFSLSVDDALIALLHASLPTRQCRILPAQRPLGKDVPLPPSLQAAFTAELPTTALTILQLPLLLSPQRLRQRPFFPTYLRTPHRAKHNTTASLEQLNTNASGRLIVGIAWDSAQRYLPDVLGDETCCYVARRSLPIPELIHIIEHPAIAERVHFVALHEQQTLRAWPVPQPGNLSVVSIERNAFEQTAAIIDACDLVVSIDMSVANLASLLGQRTWVMLMHEGEWRWERGEHQRPWLAADRTFRQERPGDWGSVVRQLVYALLQETTS